MVHHRMIPRPQRHLNNRECHNSAQRDPLGIRTAGGGIPKHKLRVDSGISEMERDSGGGIGGNFSPLHPVTTLLLPEKEDVEHGQSGEGGVVPDGLHPGDVLLSLQEHDCPGPTA